MNIIENIKTPTGNICIGKGEKGLLEFLSLGDYGKEKNLKADFLGLTKEINGVPHGDLLSLEDKWVITISSQYGCSMNCTFCDVPRVGPGKNATVNDLLKQVELGIKLHPEITHTDRLNLHYARMGEPTFNNNIFEATRRLYELLKIHKGWGFHPVISTIVPRKNKFLYDFVYDWCALKDFLLDGDAGLQLSINTTDDNARELMFSGNALSLNLISIMMNDIIRKLGMVKGRKYTLNFALTGDEIDAKKLRKLFDPKYFLCKITPMHETRACVNNNILSSDGYEFYYPYKEVEENLKEEGFDVIVFVPSKEEDESKITCGNAILANKGDVE